RLRERLDILSEPRGEAAGKRADVRALHEVLDREAGREARRASRRKHVVRPGVVIADRDRALLAEEDRARVSDERKHGPRIAHLDREMLGSDGVDPRGGLL